MNTRFVLLAASAGLLLTSVHDARAAGTALDVQSGRGTGMASSVTAFIDDSSAIFYNPAGIAQGKGLDAQVGVSLIAPQFTYTNPAGRETSLPFSIVPPVQAYAAYGITENITAGIGVFTPYGLDLDWGSGWEGRRQITSASLRTYDINPTIAGKFGPVRIGVGFQLMRATVELHRNIAFGSQEGSTDLGGGGWGVGANGGIQVEAIKKYLLAGLTYRSAIRTDFDDGQAHFSNVPPTLAGTIHDQKVTTGLTHPDQLAIALATHPIDDLVIDAEIVWLGWGKFRSIDINFPDDRSGTLSSSEPKNWSSGINYHLGAEGKVHKNWFVRGGMLYDPSPAPSNTLTPDIPDADRLNLAVGGSYRHDCGFRVDLGYQFLVLFKKHSDSPVFPGDYGGNVNILGISLGYVQPRTPESTAAPAPEPEANPPAESAPAPAPAEGTPTGEPAPSPSSSP
jgi:long-chain fatty acid transport protein